MTHVSPCGREERSRCVSPRSEVRLALSWHCLTAIDPWKGRLGTKALYLQVDMVSLNFVLARGEKTNLASFVTELSSHWTVVLVLVICGVWETPAWWIKVVWAYSPQACWTGAVNFCKGRHSNLVPQDSHRLKHVKCELIIGDYIYNEWEQQRKRIQMHLILQDFSVFYVIGNYYS